MAADIIESTGKRKTSVAKIRVNLKGDGKFFVNGKTLEEYFGNHHWQKAAALRPLAVANLGNVAVEVRAFGGGVTGQAEAIRQGLARAVAQVEPRLKKLMRDQGLLTRDARIVERKKPGRPKARKRFQFSKR